MLDRHNLRKDLFGSRSQRAPSINAWPRALGQETMGVGVCRRGYSSHVGKEEEEGEGQRKRPGQAIAPIGIPPVSYS